MNGNLLQDEIPARPEGSRWTDGQWRAIVRRDRNLLVAAAAGSGKTAVLVERIIRRVSDDSDPVDVDRLLVATFTKAAASEMRHRIGEALEDALYQKPDSDHLRKQLALLNRASITTLHSFCTEVIRRYFHLIDLDPGFRVADDTEAALLRQEELEALFEERYGESPEDHPFWQLADWFGGDRSDAPLLMLVERLYEASRSHPFPERWLNRMAAMYEEASADQPWFGSLLKDVRLELGGAAALLAEGLQLSEAPGGPAPYISTLEDELALLRYLEAAAAEGWTALHEAFQTAAFGKLKPCKKDSCDPELQEQVKQLRTDAKDKLGRLREELFVRTPEEYFAELRQMTPLMKELTKLTEEFAERYRLAKREKGLLDFTDLEHMCLDILGSAGDGDGGLVPTAAALAYREQFIEIMLDEYQDTNLVQETIVALISRQEPGNRFMVGDVKQSIYRFRLAEPGLFLEKYARYGSGSGSSSNSGNGVQLAGQGQPRDAEQAGAERAGAGHKGAGWTDVGPTGAGHKGAEPIEAEPARAEGPGGASADGERIDLAMNFRSRRQVVDGVNDLFRRVMRQSVGELDYDRDAELVCGARFPGMEEAGGRSGQEDRVGTGGGAPSPDYSAELVLVDKGDSGRRSPSEAVEGEYSPDDDSTAESGEAGGIGGGEGAAEEEAAELAAAQLEARYIGRRIRTMMGLDGDAPFPVAEKNGGQRPAQFRDFVILLRATRNWAPVLIEELNQLGIPAYADIQTGYFAATEVETVLSLLKVIDNPRQDIPLAAVLRSPLVGLSAEELARVRVADRKGDYYAALQAWISQTGEGLRAAAASPGITASGIILPYPVQMQPGWGETAAGAEEEAQSQLALAHKLLGFVRRLERWRREARQGSLSELIWDIYRETGYFDYVGGLAGGSQRQANLRALYDRSRQYEATSFRGLFRFLRFVERMREGGGDLGTARALSEQEDVVRIMSIHKSKGLEFPVVFVAGTNKLFNLTDLNGSFLIHKELGFGARYTDTALRAVYPTLPQLAIRRRMRLETLAEEMRVLYVALTRAKEKLILTGTVPSLASRLAVWFRASGGEGAVLPDYQLAGARAYLDWVMPAVLQHPEAAARIRARVESPPDSPGESGSGYFAGASLCPWQVSVVRAGSLASVQTAAFSEQGADSAEVIEAVRHLAPVVTEPSGLAERLKRQLEWEYPYGGASAMLTKTSVSELKRLDANKVLRISDADFAWEAPILPVYGNASGSSPLYRLPRFRRTRKLTPAESGTIYHTVMQHTPAGKELDEGAIRELMDSLAERRILSREELEYVDAGVIAAFYATDIGRRLASATQVRRELPFSFGLRAGEVYPDCGEAAAHELLLVQGVIDCLFEDRNGKTVLLDYKTDRTAGQPVAELSRRYRLQLELYGRAVEEIWRRKVDEKIIFYFDGAQVVAM
ncbi:MAG: addA [Paenibacillaceae bacterium]|jgi:ATP-dependent helicase/nuclease subunit A|nr:addA [Paenibacillaceae bacterium]